MPPRDRGARRNYPPRTPHKALVRPRLPPSTTRKYGARVLALRREFPAIRSKKGGRQARSVDQVGSLRVRGPCVTNCHWIRNLPARYDSALSVENNIGPAPDTIFSRNLKASWLVPVTSCQPNRVIKGYTDTAVLHLEPAIERTTSDQVFLAILITEGPTGKPLPYIPLVSRVDIISRPNIIEDRHSGFGKPQSKSLCVL